VRYVMETMNKMWRQDLALRQSLTRSDNLFWMAVAILVPFGWVFLLFRLEPVRVRVRSLRSW
jgi:hypothetical protein